MNLTIFLVFTLCWLAQMGLFVAGYQYIAPGSPERLPGGCYSELTGHMIAEQVTDIEGKCESATCEKSGYILVTGCGATLGPDCVYDYSKPYPHCCPCNDGPVEISGF